MTDRRRIRTNSHSGLHGIDGDVVTEDTYLDAAVHAIASFPVQAEKIELVSQSENIAFRVVTADDCPDYLLRLHRPGYSTIEELESEKAWVYALAKTGVRVQESLRTTEGGYYASVAVRDVREPLLVSMGVWIKGNPLREFLDSSNDSTARQDVFHQFGEIAALFHDQSTAWQLPPGFSRRRLGLDGLLGDAPFWGRFWQHPDLTPSEKELVMRARQALRSILTDYGESVGNFSLIHADFTPDNIIFDGNALAVIDFDDAAFGWHMYDIAAALVECKFSDDFENLEKAFLNGYQAVRPLRHADINVLPDFYLVRGMAIIGWYFQRPEYAGATYFERFRAWVIDECRRRGY